MFNLILDKASVNLEALDAELRATLGDDISGVSFADGEVIIHFKIDSPEKTAQAQVIVIAHDAATAVTPPKPPSMEERLTKLEERVAALEAAG